MQNCSIQYDTFVAFTFTGKIIQEQKIKKKNFKTLVLLNKTYIVILFTDTYNAP